MKLSLPTFLLTVASLLVSTTTAFSFSLPANRRQVVETLTSSIWVATAGATTGLVTPPSSWIAQAADEEEGFITSESGLKYKVLQEVCDVTCACVCV